MPRIGGEQSPQQHLWEDMEGAGAWSPSRVSLPTSAAKGHRLYLRNDVRVEEGHACMRVVARALPVVDWSGSRTRHDSTAPHHTPRLQASEPGPTPDGGVRRTRSTPVAPRRRVLLSDFAKSCGAASLAEPDAAAGTDAADATPPRETERRLDRPVEA